MRCFLLHLAEAYPTETDGKGVPLYFQTWQIREANGRFSERKHFAVNLQQRPLLLNLTKNTHFLPGAKLPVFSVKHRHDDLGTTHVATYGTATSDCHYTGSVHERNAEAPTIGWAAVSLCNGMVCANVV